MIVLTINRVEAIGDFLYIFDDDFDFVGMVKVVHANVDRIRAYNFVKVILLPGIVDTEVNPFLEFNKDMFDGIELGCE